MFRVAKALAKHRSGYAFLADLVQATFGTEGSHARIRELLEAIKAEVQRRGKQLDELSNRVQSEGFKEALIVAAERTQSTINMRKVRRFAQILGHGLCASDDFDWETAQSFIRDVSELEEDDLRALGTLDTADEDFRNNQRRYPEARTLHHERFLSQKGVLGDKFYSHCGANVGPMGPMGTEPF